MKGLSQYRLFRLSVSLSLLVGVWSGCGEWPGVGGRASGEQGASRSSAGISSLATWL